jgi:hypothetical protein
MSPQLGTVHIFTSHFAGHIDLLDHKDYSPHDFWKQAKKTMGTVK